MSYLYRWCECLARTGGLLPDHRPIAAVVSFRPEVHVSLFRDVLLVCEAQGF